MPYSGMHYGNYGDYYRGDYYRGDPFIHKTIGKVVGTVAGVVGSVVPGPVGALAKGVQRVLGGRPQTSVQAAALQGTALAPAWPVELGPLKVGTPVFPQQFGASQDVAVTKEGKPRRIRKDGKPYKRPTLNPMNPRALKRSARRIDRFTKGVRSALKHTPYTLTRRGSGRRRGSPGVITKAEASRALRS